MRLKIFFNSVLFLSASFVIMSCTSKSGNSNNMTVPARFTDFYVGTYTETDSNEKTVSQGIYKYQINDSGELRKVGLVAQSDNPSFLAFANDKNHLLAVNEVNTQKGNGTVESYQITEVGLEKLSTSSSGGAHPCHISVGNHGQVIVANYTGGNVGLLNVSKNGTLSELLDVQTHDGKGTHERQEAPHAHSSWFSPTGNQVISVDLGTNELWFSQILNNQFSFSNPASLEMNPEAGPRHLCFHPNGKYIFVLNELDNTIGVIHISEGGYVLGDTFSMLPAGFSDYSKGADIHISADGRFLYASNRGHNSIAIFSVDASSGQLTMKGTIPTKGDSPRNFQLALDDNFLVVANQKTDNIVCFKRNKETGLLTFVSEIEAPTPVCLLF